MAIIVFTLFGLVAGFIGSRLVNSTGNRVVWDAVLGILGAVMGGFFFTVLSSQNAAELNLWSLFLAVCGASLFLFLYHATTGERRS